MGAGRSVRLMPLVVALLLSASVCVPAARADGVPQFGAIDAGLPAPGRGR